MRSDKELQELIRAGIIDETTAARILTYYAGKETPSQNKLLIVFAILGTILVSLGIILILAHNWDDFTRSVKTAIAFIPLLIGQGLCAYTLWKQPHSMGWKESSAVFLFFAIGACLSLISQIYNIPGEITSFLLTWMALSIPIVYVMNSSVTSLFYIAGITYYAIQLGYWESESNTVYLYWLLLLAILPHYYLLYKNKSESNFFHLHNWFVPLSVIICLGTVAMNLEELMFVAYMSLFGLLYQIGYTPQLRDQHIRNNGYLVFGSVGTVALLMFFTFEVFWDDWRGYAAENVLTSPEFICATVLTLAATALLIMNKMNEPVFRIRPVEWVFLVFIGLFIWGYYSPVVIVMFNLVVLAIAILTIREGADRHHFGILNYGLLIIATLVICRFFDSDIGFVLKGVLFVLVGAGFFFANLWMIRKRKSNLTTPAS